MNTLKLSIDMILMQCKKFILSVLIIALTLFLVTSIRLLSSGAEYAKETCNKLLERGVANTGIMVIDDESYNSKDCMGYTKELYDTPEIKCIGTMAYYGAQDEAIAELVSIQKGKAVNDEMFFEEFLDILCINSYAMSLCELKLAKGTAVEKLDHSDGNLEYIYLGAAYSDIPIGTRYELIDGSAWVVAGIMEEGQRWIEPDMAFGCSDRTVVYSFDCEYAVFVVSNKALFLGAEWFVPEKGYSFEEARAVAKELAKKYDINMVCTSYEFICDSNTEKVGLLEKYLYKLITIILSAALVMLISMQMAIMLSSARNYGIMYSVGFSRREVNRMLLYRNIMAIILAIIINIPFYIYVVYARFGRHANFSSKPYLTNEMKDVLLTLSLKHVFPVVLLVAIAIVTLVHIVTTIILRKFAPVRLINNKF